MSEISLPLTPIARMASLVCKQLPKGDVPGVAIIKHGGEKRTNPFREKKQFDATTFPSGGDVGKLMAEEEEKDAEEEEEADEKLNKKELAEMEG